jgi:hypothetical protein
MEERVIQHLEGFVEDIHEIQIVLLGFASLERLAQRLHKHGYIPETATFWNFVRGFNSSAPNFTIAESSGSNQDTGGTGEKLIAAFRLWSSNYKCRHIIFGACHDGEYFKILQREENTSEVTLVRLGTFYPGYEGLGMRQSKSFHTIFVNEGLPEDEPPSSVT